MKVGESVWWCKRKPTIDDGEQQYEPPKEIKTAFRDFTVMSKSGNSDLLEFGEKIKDYLTIIAQPYDKWVNVFNIGDLFYCNHIKPDNTEEFFGQNANYVIDNINYGNIALKITLKKVVS